MTPTSPKETIETKGMTNREIALEIRCRIGEVEHHLATINGTVAEHNKELYGDKETHHIGIKEHTTNNCNDLATFKIAWKVISAIVGIIASGNLIAWITLLVRQ